jgi:hypothetical protein
VNETIKWIPVNQSLPDEEIIVLVKTPSPGEPVWPGYLDCGEWRSAEGGLFAYEATHWAEMPEGPK